MSVRIVRMQNGEDVIADVKEALNGEKLVGLVDDASLFYKYQETYHVSCYISRFVITECVLDLSLKEIKNISL